MWKTAFTLFATLHITQAWQFVCFQGSFNNSKYVAYQNASQHITSGFIDVNKPTAICAHGYRGSAETQGTPKLIGALSQLDINVCAIDYPREADFGGVPFLNYPIVVNLSLMVSTQMATMFINLEKSDFNPSTLHLIGHSLGAHVCGNAGRIFTERTGRQIGRITGLDAAKQGFDGTIHPFPRIDVDCAKFVTLVHTDQKKYGMEDIAGHVDFFVNPIDYDEDGVQPGCLPTNFVERPPLSPGDACSHQRSVGMYAEAINSECQLQGAKADSATEWAAPDYNATQVACMGPNSDETLRGTFYLSTASQSPYGLGPAGLRSQ